MTMEVSKTRFKSKACELLRQVEASGERLLITNRGTRTLELRRDVERAHEPLEILRGTVTRYDNPTEPVVTIEDCDALR